MTEDFSDSEHTDESVLTMQGDLYLIKQRIENLQVQIGLSFDEILELADLQSFVSTLETETEIAYDLGIPSKIDQFIASLEAKRVNRYENGQYDGGDIEDEDSSVNQFYQTLFQESILNVKSIKLLSKQKTPIRYWNGRELKLFDLFETASPKLSLYQFVSRYWNISEEGAKKKWEESTPVAQYELKEKWEAYMENRTLNTPSPLHQVLIRCNELACSPVYEEMEITGEERYRLKTGWEFRFTDKTAQFLFPLTQFNDIQKKNRRDDAVYLSVAFTLPKYAHEQKRFFRKGGTVSELCLYCQKLGIELSLPQIKYLEQIVSRSVLRLYREVLELPDRNEIRGYFLNFRTGVAGYTKGNLAECLRQFFRKCDGVNVKSVSRITPWYPEWMRKIGGIIVEEKEGKPVTIPKPQRISVDDRLPKWGFKREQLLMPSPRLLSANGKDSSTWREFFVAELRRSYRTNPRAFQDYAEAIASGTAKLHCSCNHGGVEHEKNCSVPVLMEVFRKIGKAKGKF